MGKVNFLAHAAPQEYGCFLDAGSVDGDGFAEIFVARGSGASQASQARGFNYDGVAITPIVGADVTPFTSMYGAKVALGNVDGPLGDVAEDLLIGGGPDPTADSRIEAFVSGGTQSGFVAFPGGSYGVNPGAAQLAY
jgi:hypothetical protein